MNKTSFRPCATCTVHICRKNRNPQPDPRPLIEKLIEEQRFKDNGCFKQKG